MQGSKSSFFAKSGKASHSFDDGVSKHHSSFKHKDQHHLARKKANRQVKDKPTP